jgi:ankyrin repeat protein
MANQQQVVTLLNGWGSSENAEATYEGDSAALCDAAFCGDVNVMRVLLNNNASPDEPDYDHRYPLHTACAMGHQAIVQMLLEGGATATVKDRWGGEPIMDAINNNQQPVVSGAAAHYCTEYSTAVQ